MTSGTILHILSESDWARARASGTYWPAEAEREGFVHASLASQVLRVANAAFRGRDDLLLLEIDLARLDVEVRFEGAPGAPPAGRFPHVYGPIPVAAVVAVHPFPCRADGTFDLPAPLR